MPDIGHLHPKGQIRIDAYIKLDTLNRSSCIASKQNTFSFRVNTSNKLEASIYVGGGWRVLTGDTVLQTDTWYRVAMAYNSITRKLELYLNDVKENTDLTLTGLGSYTLPQNLYDVNIAKSATNGSFFDGMIDEFSITGEDNKIRAHLTFRNEDASDQGGYYPASPAPSLTDAEFDTGFNLMYETVYNDYLGLYSAGNFTDIMARMIALTHNQDYVDNLFTQWDRLLANRDDNRRAPVYNGVALPLWRNAWSNTMAELTCNTAGGSPAIRFTSYDSGDVDGNNSGGYNSNNHKITIKIDPGVSGTYDITVENRIGVSPSTYTYTGVTLDPNDAVNYIERRINGETADPGAPRILVVKDLIRNPSSTLQTMPKTSLIPGGYYTVHDDMYLLKSFGKLAVTIKNDPILCMNASNLQKAEEIIEEIKKSLTADENMNGLLAADL